MVWLRRRVRRKMGASRGRWRLRRGQHAAFLPGQAPGLLGLLHPFGRWQRSPAPSAGPGQRQRPRDKAAAVSPGPRNSSSTGVVARRTRPATIMVPSFRKLASAEGQGFPAHPPEEMGGALGHPGPDPQAEQGQRQRAASAPVQAPARPGPGPGAPAPAGAGQRHHLRPLGQEHHDEADQQQGQLGPGVQALDEIGRRGVAGWIISLHRPPNFSEN